MASKTGTQGSVPIAKLLAVEAKVNKLTSEMEKLILISTQHGSRIKELIIASSNSVSQVEMMSTVTTTRFQHMNDLKALRKNLQAKYEELSLGGVDHGADEIDNKESKALASKINDVQNEVSNTAFKSSMEMNKLKFELKASKKDYDELKRYVNALETKLGTLIEDIQENGIKTAIKMDDMPELTYQQSAAPRRASILSPDAGGPGPAVQSSIPTHNAHPSTQIHNPQGAETIPQQLFPATVGAGDLHSPFQMHTSAAPMDPELMQQMQLQYQQQMYFQHQAIQQQYQQQQAAKAQQTAGGMPMTDSGMSTVAHSPSLTRHPSLTVDNSSSAAHTNPINSFAHHTPCFADNNSSQYPYALPGTKDIEAVQLQSLAMPVLSKEESYYKNQFKAVKELIIASMECKDLRKLEPEGLNVQQPRHEHQDKSNTTTAATTTTTTANIPAKQTHLELDDSSLAIDEQLCDAEEIGDLRSRAKLLEAFDLRHRNRDLYRNMRKVKETEKISMNYADFCVSNAVNKMDSLSYGKFQRSLQETELARLYRKEENQCEAQTQTEECCSSQRADVTAVGVAIEEAGRLEKEEQKKEHSEGKSAVSGGGLASHQQLREENCAQESAELDLLAQLTFTAARSALDFGEAIEPTHIQYSSTGRRASLLQMGCVFEQDLRDPALRFLDDTSFGESALEEEQEYHDSSSEGEEGNTTAGLGVSSNRSSPAQTKRSFVQTHTATKARMSTISSRPSIRKSSTAKAVARRFVASEEENVEIERVKQELKALMDRKLLKLYQGLDDRWKGLDQTNVNILQKLGKFQDVIVTLNADSQRLQTTVQVLAAKLAKVDSRMIDAMEPVYLALDAQKSNMSSLEELMVDVSKQLKQHSETRQAATAPEGEQPGRFTSEMSLSEMMARHRPPQLPIEAILRNSRALAADSRQRNSSEEYILEPDFHATVPASASLSEHEVEQLLRQLREYASLYEDMVHNYQLLTKRLCAEDRRNSGNFSKKNANIPGSVKVRERVYTPQEPGSSIVASLPLLSPHPPSTPARAESRCSAAAHDHSMVVRLPHASDDAVCNELPDQRMEACSPELGPESPDPRCTLSASSTAASAASTAANTSQDRLHTYAFPSPHRVLTDPFRIQHKRTSKETSTTTESAQSPALTQQELLRLLEKSDLSTNTEIIRIKSELLSVQQALRTRSANSSTNKTRIPQSPSVFPALFSTLDQEDFTVARTQMATPVGSVVRAKTPGASRGPVSIQSSGYRLAPSEVHTSQRQHPSGLILQSSPSRSGTVRLAADCPPEFEDSLQSGTAESHAPTSNAYTAKALQPSADSSVCEATQGSGHFQYEAAGGVEAGSAVAATYTPLAAEDEDGLSESSLSAYDYLIRPTAQEILAPAPALAHISAATETVTEEQPSAVTSEGKANRGRVTIVHESADPSPQPAALAADGSIRVQSRGSMWGSAARIGHTTMNTKLNPTAGLPTTARTSLLKTPGSRTGSPRATSRQSNSAEAECAASEAISRVDLLLRAEAIASGEMKGFSLTGSVRTVGVSFPTPPIKARPTQRSTSKTDKQRSVGQVSTGEASGHYNNSSSSTAVWKATPHSNKDVIGNAVASTPSVLLQGGEFFLEEECSAVSPSSGDFPADAQLSLGYKPTASVGSYPQNNSANLGENAFE